MAPEEDVDEEEAAYVVVGWFAGTYYRDPREKGSEILSLIPR